MGPIQFRIGEYWRVKHATPSSAKVKNEWRCISIPQNDFKACKETIQPVLPVFKLVSALVKWKKSRYRPEVRRWFPEVKVPRLRDGGKVLSLTHRPFLPQGYVPGTHFC